MHPAYFETRFKATEQELDWPKSFAIVTAFATTGETWTWRENEKADERLRDLLVSRDIWHTRVTGYSPETGHAEPGWAAETTLADACALGRAFAQDAVYYVQDDDLFVIRCGDSPESARVDSFRQRLD